VHRAEKVVNRFHKIFGEVKRDSETKYLDFSGDPVHDLDSRIF